MDGSGGGAVLDLNEVTFEARQQNLTYSQSCIHRRHCFPPDVLGVGDGIQDSVLEEIPQHAACISW